MCWFHVILLAGSQWDQKSTDSSVHSFISAPGQRLLPTAQLWHHNVIVPKTCCTPVGNTLNMAVNRLSETDRPWNWWTSLVKVEACLCMWRVYPRANQVQLVCVECDPSVTLTRSDGSARLWKPRVHIRLIPLKMFWFKVVCILRCQGQSKRAIAGSAVSGAREPRGDNGI